MFALRYKLYSVTNPISDRILIVRIQGRKKNMALIQAYAPTSSSEIEEAEEFYAALQHAMENIHKQDTLYILGDFNAKIGHEMSREEKEVKGIHCLGNRNERGQMLVDLCIENRLAIGNSFFKHHPRRLFTWTSPDGKTKNQIDYILVKKRWKSSIQQTKTYPGTDCGTDHELLVSTIKIKLRKMKKPESPVRCDLTQIPEEYGIEIKNIFGILMAVEEEMGPDELATHAQQILLSTAKNRIPKRKAKRQTWISNTTLELIEERRNLKANGITQDKILYKEKSREIKYSLKKDKKQYIEDQCKEMEEMHAQHKDHKLFKHARLMTTVLKPAPKAIKDKTGKVLTENIEILDRWIEYCSEMAKAE